MIDESEKEREGGLDLKGLRKEGGRDHEGKWCWDYARFKQLV